MIERLTPSEWKILKSLVAESQLTIRDLSKKAGVSYDHLTGRSGIIFRFEVWMLVKTQKMGRDKFVEVSEGGKEYFEEKRSSYEDLGYDC